MNAKLNDIRVYWGMLSGEILVGFQSKRDPRCVTGNINVTDMVLTAVSSMLLEGDKNREGSIEMHAGGIDGPDTIVIEAYYKVDRQGGPAK